MSTDRYICCDEGRRAALAGPAGPANVSGIDYIEVTTGPTLADPVTIKIVLVKPLPLPLADLTGANIRIAGGVRFPPPVPKAVVDAKPGGGTVGHYIVHLAGGQPTDFSTYTLSIVKGPGNESPPAFFDPRLSSVEFSFKVDCPSDFDCAPVCLPEMPAPEVPPFVDYRARDWPGFRRQLLDRMVELVPAFREDDPADLTTTLVEALSYRLDHQSYRLDWIGTEAFPVTAREPRSLTRHARLVDYRPGQGASARVPVSFDFESDGAHPDPQTVPVQTPVFVRGLGHEDCLDGSAYLTLLRAEPLTVFETMAPLVLWSWRNAIAFHTWADDLCMLPRGATAATLVDTGGGQGRIAAGDFLILAETHSPETGQKADADPAHRHLVRVTGVEDVTDVLDPALKLVTVRWAKTDALPFDLVITARMEGQSSAQAATVCATVLGNVTLADHGATLPPPEHLSLTPAESESVRPGLVPPAPEPGLDWRPQLDRADVSRTAPVDLTGPPERATLLSAAELMRVRAETCLPAFELHDDFSIWKARDDLLSSGRFERVFVVESGMDGHAILRFGDGINGLVPPTGMVAAATARFGVGTSGNIGPDALAHVVLGPALFGARIKVTNPMPGLGGTEPETAASIRVNAPEAFRVQDRAITAEDYAEVVRRHPQVANAVAFPHWTGSWQTVLVYIDRLGGLPVDAAFRAELTAYLERYRMIGFDVAVRAPRPAPLDIHLKVCAEPSAVRSTVAQAVRTALRPNGPLDGSPGFFHPDNLTFGAPLYLSSLIAATMAVDGVESVTPLVFQRFGRLSQNELDLGVIRPDEAEILELADDPNFPEKGRLGLTMGGGR